MAGQEAGGASRDPAPVPEVIGTGFLLSVLGAHSAFSFAKRLEPLGLTPPQVGLLRAIAFGPGRSQQSIADEFGMPPSRVVGFVDDLEAAGLVERRRDERDRRVHRLFLTTVGTKTMRRLADLGKETEEALLRSLSPADRQTLRELLNKLVVDQELTPGVHPGYRHMGD